MNKDGFDDLIVGAGGTYGNGARVYSGSSARDLLSGRRFVAVGDPARCERHARNAADLRDRHLDQPERRTHPTAARPVPRRTSKCAPEDVAFFGHSLAIGDVDGDQVDDLVIGASQSDNQRGRVFILFGHADFLGNPTQRCLKRKVPGDPSWQNFGVSISVTHLDSDNKAEIINPLSESDDTFGLQVYSLGDCGNGSGNTGTPSPMFDRKPDIGIDAESADFRGSASRAREDTGALFIYYGLIDPTSMVIGPRFVDDADWLDLQTPSSQACPQAKAANQAVGRFGRSAARVEWATTVTGLPTTRDYLLVGESERDVTIAGVTDKQAGEVFIPRADGPRARGCGHATDPFFGLHDEVVRNNEIGSEAGHEPRRFSSGFYRDGFVTRSSSRT